MATNGKNGGNNMTPNMDFSDNSSSQQQKGIFGYLENRSTKNSFAKDYWKEGSGYLDSALKDLKEMQKLYKELEKSQDKMNTSQENQFKSQKRALELQIATLEEIKQTQDVNDRDAIRSITDSNKLRNKGLLDYQKLLDNIAKRQETLKKGDKELASQLREDADYINELYASMNKEIQQQNLNIETTGEKLKNTTGSFSKAMSETLKSASDELTSLLNMFNLDKLANSGLNKFLTDKIAIQNDMMKQFGFETKSQYLDFKNGLDNSLASMNRDMGNIFSGKDLNQYMQNLSNMGITNTKMAQDQMRASIMGSKYLGVSAETQTEMFKWMKRTNDYDMLDEHNKTITGLLKSQLGVSKEQLDALSEIAYGGMEDKSALGMSTDAIQAQAEASTVMGAVLSNMYDENTAKSVQNALNDFILNPGDTKWISTFGSQYQSLYNALFSSETKEGQLNAMYKFLDGIQSSGVLNVTTGGQGLLTAIGNKKTNELTGLDNTVISALQNFDNSKYLELQQDALDGILKSNVDEFVQETTEVTWLEKIYNKIDQWITAWDSANLTSLANTVFTLWAGSKIFDVYSNISQLGLIKSLSKSSAVSTSALSSGGGLIAAAGGGVLLSAAAISALSSVADTWVNKASGVTEDDLQNALNSTSGTSFEGDKTHASVVAQSRKATNASGIKSWLGTAANVGSAWVNNLNKDDPYLYNKEYWENFERSRLGMFDEDTWVSLRYLYTLIMDKVGTPLVARDLFGLDRNALKKYIKYTPLVESKFKRAFNLLHNMTDSLNFIGMPIDYNGRDFDGNLSLDGYHKAGLDRVPKENYKALLHKDEMVLSKEEANALRKGFGFGGYDAISWPISSKYGSMSKIRSGYHTGTDFAAASGTPVGAAIGGEILQKSWGGAWGNHIIIKGDNGLYYLYAHLSNKAVSSGRVETGQTIGYVGSTGNSTGPHLHFEVQQSSNWARGNELDPAPYVTSGLLGDSSAITPKVSLSSLNSSNSSKQSSSDGTTSSTRTSKAIPVSTGRFLPSSISNRSGVGGDGLNIGGADKVVNSVDGGFAKLLNYLDGIRSEQDAQRELLNTFTRLGQEGNI